MEKRKVVIGICGTLCSGKGVVAEILRSKGCQIADTGEILREDMRSRGIVTTRAAQQDEGNRMRKQLGGQVLVEKALHKYKQYDVPLVINGIRNMVEVDFLKGNCDFTLVGVDAPFEIRWQRVQNRNRDPDLLNHDKFVIDDARDRGFNEPLDGQQTAMCLVHADLLINNDEEFSRLEESKLYRDVIDIYRKIVKKHGTD